MIIVCGYIDPSAVTYMIQAVAAVAIAGGAALTVLRHRITALLHGRVQKAAHAQIIWSEEPAPLDLYEDGAAEAAEDSCS